MFLQTLHSSDYIGQNNNNSLPTSETFSRGKRQLTRKPGMSPGRDRTGTGPAPDRPAARVLPYAKLFNTYENYIHSTISLESYVTLIPYVKVTLLFGRSGRLALVETDVSTPSGHAQ